VEQAVADLLDTVADRPELELLRDLAQPLPAAVMARLFGAPPADRDHLALWTESFVAATATAEPAPTTLLAALQDVSACREYLRDLVARHRAEPRQDLLQTLLDAEAAGDRLAEDELLDVCYFIMVAGAVVTQQLAKAALALLRRPDYWRRLHKDPSRVPGAVPELLRQDGTVLTVTRAALASLEICGTPIEAGQRVALCLSAANHDPARFPDPDQLDLARPSPPHLSFGHGIHRCLGAALARLELEIALGALCRRYPHARLTSAPLRWQVQLFDRALWALPVAVG
jgi:cytochrome P450